MNRKGLSSLMSMNHVVKLSSGGLKSSGIVVNLKPTLVLSNAHCITSDFALVDTKEGLLNASCLLKGSANCLDLSLSVINHRNASDTLS